MSVFITCILIHYSEIWKLKRPLVKKLKGSFKSLIQWYVHEYIIMIHTCKYKAFSGTYQFLFYSFHVWFCGINSLTQPQNPQSKKFHVFLYKIGTHFTAIGTSLWPQGNSLYDLASIINHSIHYLRVNLFLVTPPPPF